MVTETKAEEGSAAEAAVDPRPGDAPVSARVQLSSLDTSSLSPVITS